MKRIGLLILLTVLALVVACHTAKATDSVLGAQLYQSNCEACHGANATGAKVGNVTAPDIRAQVLKSDYQNDSSLIKNAILNGKDAAGEDLDPTMPRFAGTLSDSDASAITTHLLSLQ